MSVAASAFDACGLAVVIALTAFAMLDREPEPTHELVVTQRDPEPAQRPATTDPAASSPEGSSRRAHQRYALPGDGSHALTDDRPSLVLQVRIDGAVRVRGRAFDDRNLDNLFRAAFAHDRSTQIVLMAQKGVAHRRMVDLMERVKAAGLKRIAIGTDAAE